MEISCPGTGQDGEIQLGQAWPRPRFKVRDGVVADRLTGLVWLKDANHGGFPVAWDEALQEVRRLNQLNWQGIRDWRLPNRRELRSLLSHQHSKPALPSDHKFSKVFQGWYWTSTSAALNPAYAWYVHTEGGRMFYGHKSQYCLVWPVSGQGNGVLPQTGQKNCYDQEGKIIKGNDTGQDGDLCLGAKWPESRFEVMGEAVKDNLTGLAWSQNADLARGSVDWQASLDLVKDLNLPAPAGYTPWRIPNINELESLVDASRHSPALPAGHPFIETRETYWSSTTSAFETDWAMALYLHKGAVGVGQKSGRHFHVWAVCSELE
jgi:hypothetical protein